MYKILNERQTGRTTELIKRAAEHENRGEVSYIVCSSQREAYRIAKQARKMGLNIGFPITYDEFLRERHYSPHIAHLLIDNADHLLQHLTPIHIDAITLELDRDR